MILGSCVTDEPVWCDATLYLTLVNQGDKMVSMDYQLNPKTYIWKDSLVMIEKSGEKKEEITLKLRNIRIDPKGKVTDTITYKYYQSDGPCARDVGSAKYLKVFLNENTGLKLSYEIYPWSPDIFSEYVCDGCENINYDTIVLK